MRRLNRNIRVEATGIVAGGVLTVAIDVPNGPSWEVKQMAVSMTGGTLVPQCSTYIGRNSAGVFISSTLRGDQDTDSAPNVTARSGEALCAVWSSATNGAKGKLTVLYDEVPY